MNRGALEVLCVSLHEEMNRSVLRSVRDTVGKPTVRDEQGCIMVL